jgi:hypothetical protein
MLRTTSTDNNQTSLNFQQFVSILRFIKALILIIGIITLFNTGNANAQGPVNGSFVGQVIDAATKTPIANATVSFNNIDRGFQTAAKTDANGNFSRTALPPGNYQITVNVDGYQPQTKTQSLYATRSNDVVPVPFELTKTGSPVLTTTTTTTQTAPVASQTVKATTDEDTKVTLNPRRDGAFDAFSVMNLPLGGTTLTRTFDELALLIPGVNPPPQAIGNTVGPGVGGGVGTSGQFSVNGLRSRANNFTVDGSDNNDEDIGVRRQGFFTLVPQPIESIQEFQIITLLAPAQYGRNLGAQVNALSRSGSNRFNGTIYGLFNADFLNAANYFDTTSGNTTTNLTGLQSGGTSVPVFVDGRQKQVTNFSGNKDAFGLVQGGFAIGGPIVRQNLFFFASGEGQYLDGTKEKNFAVPTVEQRGLDTSGASGLQQCRLIRVDDAIVCQTGANFVPGFPTSIGGDAVFSLFPFPNNPTGVFGRNTYSQALSIDARGGILSGKIDYTLFGESERPQTLTARYNYTEDGRNLTDVGGAIFSAIRPLVRTDNFSTYLAGNLSVNISNEFRFSWGRTRLKFKELRDTTFLSPISNRFQNPDDARFLLSAPLLLNLTLPINCSPTGCVAPPQATYATSNGTTENSSLGPIGQLIIAGFSPVGVDVFNFPQERKNNTFQFADTLRWQINNHSLSFGADIRKTELESNLPRNSRPLVTFNGGVDFRSTDVSFTNPLDLAASDGATGFFQSLVLSGSDSRIKLNYFQYNFFIQDEWRIRPNFNLNFGLRYEYNTPPEEADNKIENTFNLNQSLFPSIGDINTFQGFSSFIDGRTKIFDSDLNNFAPRIGFAWSPNTKTVIRGGYGIYYDQVIGAVVSQSRNVFPTFTTVNTGGGELACANFFRFLNPITGNYSPTSCGSANRFPLVQPGTLNTLNPQFNRLQLLTALLGEFPFENGTSFGATLPTRILEMPMSHQYSIGLEQQIFKNTFFSVAYVGTMGRNLLRFTTPNLGNNYISLIDTFTLFVTDNNGNPVYSGVPRVIGTTFDPFVDDLERPNRNIGPINQFETTGNSRYDALQFGLRGRLSNSFQYQLNYTYSKVKDDVSDVFDLAGAFALPQNSLTFEGEYAPANFDVRHRFTYNFVYVVPAFEGQNNFVKAVFGNWIISGIGRFNTGQPFTVNSIFDVNFDGNLTDRLDNTRLITQTNNGRQPLLLAAGDITQMLADFGNDGSVPRNSFRAGNLLELDLSFSKSVSLSERQKLQFRVDIFNFINRANFGIPVRFLGAPGFGQATDTVTPGRRIQIAVKYNF